MYALIDEDQVFAVEGIGNAEKFFAHLPIILYNTAWIVGIGCYDPNLKVKSWFEQLPRLEVSKEFDYRYQFELHRRSYPNGDAYYLRADPRLFERLASFASRVPSPTFVCDHFIAYLGDRGILSFHDAFDRASRMLVSKNIPEELIQKFCVVCKCCYSTIQNPDHYERSE